MLSLTGNETAFFDMSDGPQLVATTRASWATVSVARNLERMGASSDLVRDVETAATGKLPLSAGPQLSLHANEFFLGGVTEDSPVFSEPVRVPLLVLAAAAPESVGSKVSAELTASGSSSGGLALKLSGIGFKGSLKYSFTETFKISCTSGQATLGYLLLPAIRDVFNWQPSPAGEKFLVERLRPAPKSASIGVRTVAVGVAEVQGLSSSVPAPIEGSAAKAGSQSHEYELNFSAELGFKFGDKDASSFGLSADLNGSLAVSADYDLPSGNYTLRWLKWPAGVQVAPA